MIEEKLQALEKAVLELNGSIKSLTAEMGLQKSAATEKLEPKAQEKPAAKAKAQEKPAAKAKAKKPEPVEPEPDTVEEPLTEPASDVPEDWGDEVQEVLTLDEFRAAVLPLGKEHGPELIKGAGYEKLSDVPESERAALAAKAKEIKAKLPQSG